MRIRPTYLQWEVNLGVDDNERKYTRKARPFLPLPLVLGS
jgi:hypothetical protein